MRQHISTLTLPTSLGIASLILVTLYGIRLWEESSKSGQDTTGYIRVEEPRTQPSTVAASLEQAQPNRKQEAHIEDLPVIDLPPATTAGLEKSLGTANQVENPVSPTDSAYGGIDDAPNELPAELKQKIRAVELLDEALILDRCVSVPRERDAQLRQLDSSRADQSRTEEELLSTFDACAYTPIASRNDVTSAYREAADAGSADAQFRLAGRYPLGSDENLRWNHVAANNGHIEAQLTLARIHLEKNTDTDNLIAYRWLRNSQRSGSVLSQYYLDRLERELSSSAWQALNDSGITNNQ